MDLLLMTDHLRKLSAEPHFGRRRAIAASGLAILAFTFLAVALVSMPQCSKGRLPHATTVSTTEDAR